MEEGFDDFIAKPIELSVLERMLRRYIPTQKQIDVDDETERDAAAGADSGTAVLSGAGSVSPAAQSLLSEEKGLKDLEQAGINVRLALSYCGDRDGLRDIAIMYHSQGEQRNSQIEQLYKEENWKNYAIAVHALKSNSKGIGAEELAEFALSLEMAGKENRVDYILDHHEELIEKHNALLNALAVNSFLYPEGYRGPDSEDDDSSASGAEDNAAGEGTTEAAISENDEKLLEKQMGLLREKLDNYESDGLSEILDKLSKCRYHDTDLKEMTGEIRNKVNEFDFLGASEVLDSWEEKISGSAV